MATSDKFIPGSDTPAEEIFTYPFFIDEGSKDYIKSYGKIMFIIRGPPGTGKWSLTELMMQHFPTGIKCSADDYFTNTFSSPVRTKESLAQSHSYCHRRVKQECAKNSHPVIVSNTHMKKREMQEYLNMAAEYEYTIIISSTLDKFKATPEILAKSNTKGLSKEYFQNRLKAWQEVFPMLMGWFFCPDDSLYILHQLQSALDALLGDGKFCSVFKVFDTDTLLNNYKAKTLLYCLSGFMKSSPFELKEYYKSPQVRNSYGKCFMISIQAFLVTKSNIFGIVKLDNNLKKLIFKPNFVDVSVTKEDDDVNNIVNSIQHMSLQNSYNFKFTSLKSKFSQTPKTSVLGERSDDNLDIKNLSFVHLAQKEGEAFSTYELNQLFRKKFTSVGILTADQFNTVLGEYAVCRLDNDGWIIKIPKILSKTVFTGLYI